MARRILTTSLIVICILTLVGCTNGSSVPAPTKKVATEPAHLFCVNEESVAEPCQPATENDYPWFPFPSHHGIVAWGCYFVGVTVDTQRGAWIPYYWQSVESATIVAVTNPNLRASAAVMTQTFTAGEPIDPGCTQSGLKVVPESQVHQTIAWVLSQIQTTRCGGKVFLLQTRPGTLYSVTTTGCV